MIKLKFLPPKDSIGIVKGTVHRSGKLGFSSGAIKKLNLDKNPYYKIAINEEDMQDKDLYLVPSVESDSEALKASKAGDYYYLRIKHILDHLRIDYVNETVIFDINEVTENEMKYYKLTRRKPTGKNNF
jgi:hypothetical protein